MLILNFGRHLWDFSVIFAVYSTTNIIVYTLFCYRIQGNRKASETLTLVYVHTFLISKSCAYKNPRVFPNEKGLFAKSFRI